LIYKLDDKHANVHIFSLEGPQAQRSTLICLWKLFEMIMCFKFKIL